MSVTSIASLIRQEQGMQPAEVVELLRAMASAVKDRNAHLRETQDILQELDALSDYIEDSYCQPMTDEERSAAVAERMKEAA